MILGIQGVLNPPQKLAEGEKMPEPAGKKNFLSKNYSKCKTFQNTKIFMLEEMTKYVKFFKILIFLEY